MNGVLSKNIKNGTYKNIIPTKSRIDFWVIFYSIFISSISPLRRFSFLRRGL